MKRSILFAVSLALQAAAAYAQQPADTTFSSTLDEFVVEAPKVVHKADMDVYQPSKSAVENAANGMQLLQNLMIPSVLVNDVLGTVSAGGENVQVRINGRTATLQQVKNLLPETIKRVEWIDNPGLRYQGATAVLNFIVTNPTLGGSVMINGLQALNARMGTYDTDAKFNSGKSQWNVGGYYKLTKDIHTYRDYTETFTYPDGTSLTRVEHPLGGNANDNRAGGWLGYSYIRPDTTILYVNLRLDRDVNVGEEYDGLLSLSDGTDDIQLRNGTRRNGSTPSFSAYLEQHLPRRQTIVVDFGASLYMGRSISDYRESLADGSILSDISTNIYDRNQAYAIEADYIKKWRRARFTAGATYRASRNRSLYHNLDNAVFHQRQDRLYLFAEYFQSLGKFTLTGGMGAQYNDYLFRESDRGNRSWDLRPKATLTYSFNRNHKLRLAFTSWQSTPSLSQTNVAPQQIDGFQWLIGNPSLSTSNSYRLDFRYSFSLPRVEGSFLVRGFTSPDAIAPYSYWDADRLITTYENSRGRQYLLFALSPQVDVVPGWLMLSGDLRYTAERTSGTGYRLYNHNWSGEAQLMAFHWGFNLVVQYRKAMRSLSGQTISWGEDFSILQLAYNWRNWQFGAGMFMPFGRYDQGSASLNRWNTNTKHMRLDLRFPFLKLSYNVNWGRQKRSASKLINADSSVDTSSAGTR